MRAEIECQLKEIGRGSSCTTCAGVFCGFVERPDGLLIAAGRGKRQVARSLFDVKLGAGDLPMHCSSLFGRRHAVYGGGEDRMGESDHRTVHLDEANILCTFKRSSCTRADNLSQNVDCRCSKGCRRKKHFVHWSIESSQSSASQFREGRRQTGIGP